MCVICILLHIVYVRNILYYNYNNKTKSRRDSYQPTDGTKQKIERQRNYTMRKTNSKEVKAAVRKYLLECDEITIVEMKERFLNEYGHEIKRYGQINACINWLRGLAINVDFYYCDIVKRLAEWLDDTEENQWKYIDKKGDDLYWLLIAREIIASK